MSDKLEIYLEKISHFLEVGREKQEILTEIRSHIMEKAEREFGEVTENSLERVIDAYGSPRHVAEKYLEDSQIIAPAYKGHLIRYTAILFAFHFSLIVLSFIFKTSMAVLPFFYIPPIDSFQAVFYLPMAFVFDLGLAGIILYFVTQSRKEINLPWPKLKLDWQKIGESRASKSKIVPFILMILGYAALVWIYVRSGTLFFKTIDFQQTQPLIAPEASQWYSLALLAFLGAGIAAYAIKFITTSEWVNLVRSACQLIIIGIVINNPLDDPFSEFIYFDLQIIANIIIVIVAILLAIEFLKSLIILGIKSFAKNPHSR